MKIPIGISNRHIHLNEDTKNKLLGEDFKLEVKRFLRQKGEFASSTTLSIKTDKGQINSVRVIGPLREYTQVEILKSDMRILGICPPLRDSGDLDSSECLTLIGPKGEVYIQNCCIIANRHIHMNEEDAKKFNLTHNEVVRIKKENVSIENVHIKVNNSYELECHLDKDDEIKYDIHNGDLIEIERKEKC